MDELESSDEEKIKVKKTEKPNPTKEAEKAKQKELEEFEVKSYESGKSLNTNYQETVTLIKNLIRVDVPSAVELDGDIL